MLRCAQPWGHTYCQEHQAGTKTHSAARQACRQQPPPQKRCWRRRHRNGLCASPPAALSGTGAGAHTLRPPFSPPRLWCADDSACMPTQPQHMSSVARRMPAAAYRVTVLLLRESSENSRVIAAGRCGPPKRLRQMAELAAVAPMCGSMGWRCRTDSTAPAAAPRPAAAQRIDQAGMWCMLHRQW